MEEHLCKDILNSIKEDLRIKWPFAQPEGEQSQLLANAPWPEPCTELAAANHFIYEKFTTAKDKLYQKMIALVRDAHQWALVAVAILKARME